MLISSVDHPSHPATAVAYPKMSWGAQLQKQFMKQLESYYVSAASCGSGLAGPADESMLAPDIGTTRRSENIIASGVHRLHCGGINLNIRCKSKFYEKEQYFTGTSALSKDTWTKKELREWTFYFPWLIQIFF